MVDDGWRAAGGGRCALRALAWVVARAVGGRRVADCGCCGLAGELWWVKQVAGAPPCVLGASCFM